MARLPANYSSGYMTPGYNSAVESPIQSFGSGYQMASMGGLAKLVPYLVQKNALEAKANASAVKDAAIKATLSKASDDGLQKMFDTYADQVKSDAFDLNPATPQAREAMAAIALELAIRKKGGAKIEKAVTRDPNAWLQEYAKKNFGIGPTRRELIGLTPEQKVKMQTDYKNQFGDSLVIPEK